MLEEWPGITCLRKLRTCLVANKKNCHAPILRRHVIPGHPLACALEFYATLVKVITVSVFQSSSKQLRRDELQHSGRRWVREEQGFLGLGLLLAGVRLLRQNRLMYKPFKLVNYNIPFAFQMQQTAIAISVLMDYSSKSSMAVCV